MFYDNDKIVIIIPWKSNHHVLWVGFRATIILVRVYHLPSSEARFLKWWLTSRVLLLLLLFFGN